jgi:hypothetical protein
MVLGFGFWMGMGWDGMGRKPTSRATSIIDIIVCSNNTRQGSGTTLCLAATLVHGVWAESGAEGIAALGAEGSRFKKTSVAGKLR